MNKKTNGINGMADMRFFVARALLKFKTVKLRPEDPFTWASGWKSPIYCDNRKIFSHVELRKLVIDQLIEITKTNFTEFDTVVGVATGAISPGAIIAYELGKPFCYVRSEKKDHGLENLIEGVLEPGQKVLIIEDLISTGGSSLKAVEAVRKIGAEVIGMVAIFSYEFPIAKKAFENAGIALTTLSNYSSLLNAAIKDNYIKQDDLDVLKKWRLAPDTWKK